MRRTTLGLSALILVASCKDACWTKDYSFAWHGQNVSVYGYDLTQEDACGGSFAELDAHAGMIMEAFGVSESENYTYRWISDSYWLHVEPCPAFAYACATNAAMSRSLPDMHEIVHLVTDSIDEDGCPNVLDEGLAVVYDTPATRWDIYLSADDDLVPLLTARRIPPTVAAFMRAGHFVSFLMESHGVEAVVELCRAIPKQSTLSQWDAAASRILGTSLDQLLEQYATYPECSLPQIRARLWGCGGEPDFIFSAKNDQFIVDAGCSDSQATNGAPFDFGDAMLLRRVYFESDTWVEISAYSLGDSGTGATYISQQCAACSEDPQVLVELDDVDTQFYRAGLHEVSVFFDKRDPIRLSMKKVQ